MTYEEKLEEAKRLLYQNANADQKYVLESLFPELKEDEDKKNIKDLIDELKCSLRAANCQNNICRGGHEKRIALLKWSIDWLEKQQPFDKDKLAKKFLRSVAISIMNWLDTNTPESKMCLSNMECEDIENAVCNADWMRIYYYMQKKLEDSLMLNADNVIDWLDYSICDAYDYDGNNISSTLKEKFIKDFKL